MFIEAWSGCNTVVQVKFKRVFVICGHLHCSDRMGGYLPRSQWLKQLEPTTRSEVHTENADSFGWRG